ncbi:NUDIX domain-containing protein [Planococcus sp. N028]|uniref:NUDIX domain-containing protein n=1 Tax=Planococcus shixiaomingii TaxID=3058393 RepID=A0ABT8N620_9BACL|nr:MULTISPECIES: NUDIX domain-containing protein [unclassified Planococcus (in: firmicutes)]MDN7243097.1 NUDIX domain-containing protein [Planococcus sp. N028]WKA55044.1 NUDIX domain-containing protein [Planococcus sp. N022]
MRYIESLKEKMGNDPLLAVRTSLVILDKKGHILLKKGRDGMWSLPVSFMELDETAEEAGRRAVKEETGIDIGELSLLGIFSGKKHFQEMSNDDQLYPLTINYCTTDILTPLPLEEWDESFRVEFFAIDQLPSSVNLHTKKVIHHYGASFY